MDREQRDTDHDMIELVGDIAKLMRMRVDRFAR